MDNDRKIIVIKSNSFLGGDERLFWLFSKNQLELVLKEIERISLAPANGFCEATIAWQDDILPVVHLEKYFGIPEASLSSPAKHLILKGAVQEGQELKMSMIAIPVYAELKMGSLNFTGSPITPEILKTNSTDILGAYELAGRKIVVIPDICKIASRSRLLLMDQGKQ